jgi:hypothetical protein
MGATPTTMGLTSKIETYVPDKSSVQREIEGPAKDRFWVGPSD